MAMPRRSRTPFAARTEPALSGTGAPDDRVDRAALLGWLTLSRTGALAPGADVVATSRAWFDELRLAGPLAAGLREAGLDEGAAWAVADRVRVLLALPRPSEITGPAATADARLLERWLANDVVRTAIGVNTWEGVEWLDRDRFATMLGWAVRLDAIEGVAPRRGPGLVERMTTAADAAGYDVARLRSALAVKPSARGSTTSGRLPRRKPSKPG